MPRGDGTGPLGYGPISGRGFGACTGVNAGGRGRGLNCRRGYGMNFAADPMITKTQKELLSEQKELLQNRLDIISKQLENL